MVNRAKNVVIAVVLVAACGGKKGDTTPKDNGGWLGGPHQDAPDMSGQMVSPEKMDEIERLLDRKSKVISRCLSTAVDNKELPKNSRGKVTLDITISPAGKADSVKVIKATLDSAALNNCIIDHVKEIQFPDLPKPYPTSHTYAFEAM